MTSQSNYDVKRRRHGVITHLHLVVVGIMGHHFLVEFKFDVSILWSLGDDSDIVALTSDGHGRTGSGSQLPQHEIHTWKTMHTFNIKMR